MMKKAFRYLLGVGFVALLFVFSGVAAQAYEVEAGDFRYNVWEEAGTASVITYLGTSADAVIADEVDGYPVVAFYSRIYAVGMENVSSLTLPKYFRTINHGISMGPLRSCPELAEILVHPENTNFVAEDGILYSKDKTVLWHYPQAHPATEYIMPDSVREVGAPVFANVKHLEHLALGSGYSILGAGEYQTSYVNGNKLRKLTLSVNSQGVPSSWLAHEEIVVPTENPYLTAVDGVVYNKEKTIVRRCPQAKTGSVTLPATVTEISDTAFFGCWALTEIQLPPGLKKIGRYAFGGPNPPDACGIVALELPEGLESVGDYAFSRTNIRSITLPNSLKTIGSSIFNKCEQLESLHIGSGLATGVEKITSTGGNVIFQGCTALKEITVHKDNPSYVAKDNVLFSRDMKTLLRYPAGHPAESYTVPAGVEYLLHRAFEGSTNLKDIYFPESCNGHGYYIFEGCAFTVHGYWYTVIRGQAENKKLPFVSIDSVPRITKITITPALSTIKAGEEIYLDAVVEGENLRDQSVQFKLNGRTLHGNRWDSSEHYAGPTRSLVRTAEWMLPCTLTVTAKALSIRDNVMVEATAQIIVENKSTTKYWRLPNVTFYRQNTASKTQYYYDEKGKLLFTHEGTNWDMLMAYDDETVTWRSAGPNWVRIDEQSGRVSINRGVWPKTGKTVITAYVDGKLAAAFDVRVTWNMWLWPIVILFFGWLYL